MIKFTNIYPCLIVPIKNRRSSVVKTRTSMREIQGIMPTIYEFSVWKESGAPPDKCALLVFSK